ncbi:ketoacyl-ACP synthase III [Mobilitalea sibirica]|uniref:Beta-ketoacyl-[acyl-carrier-protein] synthase III n=2 Tax=Mobilitalea sibirica TaxID=1462919 RepID=A0A8J7H164_9FIRM|nr:beta-ketoacyl-ACP synthase III [Mobilitalea sibirica]MBH1940064.1 ketoacyl-ACP synthase III [Mobilitalea sibirica]
MRHATITGTGSYVPENVMTNDDLAKLVDTSDEWIASRTGIRERRISTGQNTSDLAYEAAVRALADANLEAADIDLIICATITPDSFMPSVACIVQDRLGADKAAAFDITAACTGMIYAMVTAEKFIASGMYQKVLVIGAETLSKVLDWEDRSTCVLFGDGAGAVVLSASEHKKGIMAAHLLSDGSKQSLLTCPAVPLSDLYSKEGKRNFNPVIAMQGQEVFKFAVRTVTENINAVLRDTSLKAEDIQFIIPHQANRRIIEQAAKFCNVPIEKFYINLDRFGNTSAATIGIALDEMAQNKELKQGDKIILVGFGGGMTSGAVLLEWDKD